MFAGLCTNSLQNLESPAQIAELISNRRSRQLRLEAGVVIRALTAQVRRPRRCSLSLMNLVLREQREAQHRMPLATGVIHFLLCECVRRTLSQFFRFSGVTLLDQSLGEL